MVQSRMNGAEWQSMFMGICNALVSISVYDLTFSSTISDKISVWIWYLLSHSTRRGCLNKHVFNTYVWITSVQWKVWTAVCDSGTASLHPDNLIKSCSIKYLPARPRNDPLQIRYVKQTNMWEDWEAVTHHISYTSRRDVSHHKSRRSWLFLRQHSTTLCCLHTCTPRMLIQHKEGRPQ
jgi:hypothetical protein